MATLLSLLPGMLVAGLVLLASAVARRVRAHLAGLQQLRTELQRERLARSHAERQAEVSAMLAESVQTTLAQLEAELAALVADCARQAPVEAPAPVPVPAPVVVEETADPVPLVDPRFPPPHLLATQASWGDAWANDDAQERLEELAEQQGGDWNRVSAVLVAETDARRRGAR